MSLFDAAERFASIDRSQVTLDAQRCLHSKDQASNCAACLELCPVNAIAPEKPPVLDSETCQSCLACLPACPVGAIRADDDVSPLLNCVARVEGRSVELVCGSHPQPGTGENAESIGIQVRGCLAGLGTGALLLLSALGLERIVLRTDACSTCKWGSLREEIDRQAVRADRFLAAWQKAGSLVSLDQVANRVERPVWDVKNPPLSRRDLFRLLARQGQVAMARAMENGISPSARQPGRDRLRLLSAKSHLHEPAAEASASLEGLSFGMLSVSSECNACGSCARVCSTEALHFEKTLEDTVYTLTFQPKNCISCDLCVHVCAPDAILLERAPSFEQVFGAKDSIVVETGGLVRCERCKSLMASRPGTRLCSLCEYRKSHPFGSILPEELKSMLKKTNKELH